MLSRLLPFFLPLDTYQALSRLWHLSTWIRPSLLVHGQLRLNFIYLQTFPPIHLLRHPLTQCRPSTSCPSTATSVQRSDSDHLGNEGNE